MERIGNGVSEAQTTHLTGGQAGSSLGSSSPNFPPPRAGHCTAGREATHTQGLLRLAGHSKPPLTAWGLPGLGGCRPAGSAGTFLYAPVRATAPYWAVTETSGRERRLWRPGASERLPHGSRGESNVKRKGCPSPPGPPCSSHLTCSIQDGQPSRERCQAPPCSALCLCTCSRPSLGRPSLCSGKLLRTL